MRSLWSKYFSLMVLAACAASVYTYGQSTGALVGTVHDASGAVIPSASVTATDVLTGISIQTKTGSSGDYSFPGLSTGRYKLTVTTKGFKTLVVEQVEIHVASTIRQDATLTPASVSSEVVVISSTPLLDTESAEVGQLVEADQITELPLNGRDVYSLLTLTAGAESNANNNNSAGFNGYESPSRPAIAGERAGYTVFRIDDTNVNTQGLPHAAVTPNIDAVQEFRSITQLGSAADSGPGSVFINLRSGSNKFHGAAYDFLRNNVLDAEPYFYEPTPPIAGYSSQGEQLRYNQFGGTVGGPIWRNRTFFLGSTQLLRWTNTTQARNLYPTAAMLKGDFSGMNPATQQSFGPIYVPGSGGSATFAGNQVPIISPVAQALIPLAFMPANCMSCLSAGLGIDSVQNQQSYQNDTQTIAKIEHHLSDKDQLSGSYIRDYSDGTSNANVIKYWTQDLTTGVNIASLREAHTFTPNLLNTFNLGFVRFHQIQEPANNANGTLDFQQNMTYNVPRLGPGPVMASGGYPWTIAPFVLFNEVDWSYDYNDNLNWTHGPHNISVGFEAVRDDSLYAENWNALLLYADGFGSFGFTNYEFSDFEQGVPLVAGTQQGIGGTPGVKRTIYETYFQDDWKVAPRLTIDLGLRYELPERWRDVGSPKYNRIGTLDTSTASMAVGGQFLIAGSSNVYIPGKGIVPGNGPVVPDGLERAQKSNIQPRIGFAYRPFDDKTVIRGGFGIYYAIADEQSVVFEMESPPWQFTNQFVNATVSFNLPNPFGYYYPIYPTYTDTHLFPKASVASGGVGQKGISPSSVDARSYQWSFSVERQLSKSFKVSAEYVGNENAHLPTVVYVNQPGLPNATQLVALEANPASDATAAQARAPFTGIVPGYEFLESVGTSSYNALYLVASGQLARGLTLSASYIWSKSMDVASSEDMATDFAQPNLRMNRSLSLFNHPQRFIASWVYNLPFGDTVGRTNSRVLNQIISGWETTGIASFEQGYPFSVYAGIDTEFIGAGNSYPNLMGPLVHSNIRKTNGIYLTPQNFGLAPWGTFGFTRRNQFTGPGVDNFDLGFMRNFKLYKGMNLQLRGELFNAFNHGQFQMGSQALAESMSAPTAPSTTPTVTFTPTSQFGRVTQSANQPSRVAQVAVKFLF